MENPGLAELAELVRAPAPAAPRGRRRAAAPPPDLCSDHEAPPRGRAQANGLRLESEDEGRLAAGSH